MNTPDPDFITCVTTIEPRQQGQFPDPVRFPHPPGKEINCGCLATAWSAGGTLLTPNEAAYCNDDNRGPLLETVWYPIWDTHKIPDGPFTMHFFQHGQQGRPYSLTNLESAGSFTYPDRMHVWEIEFQFDKSATELELVENMGSAVVTFHIGEKHHFRLPLAAFYQKSATRYAAALCHPLLIPTVQNFRISLESTSRRFGLGGSVRCLLHGYRHRSIP